MTTPIRILIVEDSPEEAELRAGELRRCRCGPDWVRVEPEADLLALLGGSFEAIKAECEMPQFDASGAQMQLFCQFWILDFGFWIEKGGCKAFPAPGKNTICPKLVLQESREDIRSMGLTGSRNAEVAVECVKRGAADCLPKDRLAQLGPAVAPALRAKQLRDEKRSALAQVRETAARFRQLADSAPDIIYGDRLTPTPCKECVSKRGGSACLPHAGAALRRSRSGALKIAHPDRRRLLREWCSREIPIGVLVWRWIYKNGRVIWMENRSVPVRDLAGNTIAVEGTARDITRLTQGEEALPKAYDELEIRFAERTAELRRLKEQLLLEMARRQQAQEALRRRKTQLQTLYQVAGALSRGAPIEEIYEAALQLQQALGVSGAGILLVEGDGVQRFQEWRGLSDRCRLAVEDYFLAGVGARSPQSLLISDVGAQISLEPLRAVLLQEGIRAVGFIPLVFQGRLLGNFALFHSTVCEFCQEEVQLAETVASQMAFAIERAGAAVVAARAERERSSEAEGFRRIFQRSPIGMALAGADCRLLKVNRAFCEMLGYAESELAGLSIADITHPEDMSKQMPFLERVLQGETDSFQLEKRYITKNREILWVNLSLMAIRNPAGEILYILGMVEDITHRVEAQSALRSSEERFRQLAENIRQVFWMRSADSKQLLYVSPAYEEIWGRSCESLYEEPLSWLLAVYPEDREAVRNAVEQLPEGEAVQKEYRIVLPDGSVRWIGSRAFPVRKESGEIYRIAGIAEDITGRKHSEVELRKALETEKELNELKSRFVSMVSHEFRNPLCSIVMSVELLENFGALATEEKKRDYLHRIKAAARQMTDLLENVLVIGRAEAGKLEFDPAPVDVEAFCRDLLEQMQLSAGCGHSISFVSQSFAAGVLESTGGQKRTSSRSRARGGHKAGSYPCDRAQKLPCLDEKLLRHILGNLLSNAVKYSPQGGTVRLSLFCEGGEVVFEISDQGIGIPSDDLPHLFESFHRAANVGKIPGTGLGLAIVKRAVDLHGGEISVRSEVGAGTTFSVRLPVGCRTVE